MLSKNIFHNVSPFFPVLNTSIYMFILLYKTFSYDLSVQIHLLVTCFLPAGVVDVAVSRSNGNVASAMSDKDQSNSSDDILSNLRPFLSVTVTAMSKSLRQ